MTKVKISFIVGYENLKHYKFYHVHEKYHIKVFKSNINSFNFVLLIFTYTAFSKFPLRLLVVPKLEVIWLFVTFFKVYFFWPRSILWSEPEVSALTNNGFNFKLCKTAEKLLPNIFEPWCLNWMEDSWFWNVQWNMVHLDLEMRN